MNAIVTIGMPVYDGERFIADALDRLLAQSRGDFVIHVADNASSDATPEIVQDYARRDHRVIYHRHRENYGAAYNVNYLIKSCNTKYFKLAAHDDHHEPSYLERCLAPLEADDNIVLCHSLTTLIDAEGRPCPVNLDAMQAYDHTGRAWPIDPIGRRLDSPNAHERFHDFIHHTILVGEIWGIIRHEALMRTRLFGRYFGSDRPMLAELALMGPFAIVPAELFSLRLHGTHATRQDWRERGERVDATAPPSMMRFSGLHTYVDFGRAVLGAPISRRERASAAVSWAKLPLDRRVLGKLLLPGPFSYLGIDWPRWWPQRPLKPMSPLALRPGERLQVRDGVATVQDVEQRNWSRVAAAIDDDGSRSFVKQHLTNSGDIDLEQLDVEITSNRQLSSVLKHAQVPTITAVDKSRALVIYKWCRLKPPDRLLREDRGVFEAEWKRLLRGLPDMIAELAAAVGPLGLSDGSDGGEPGHGTPEQMVIFEGFEIRNVAAREGVDEVVLFDTGPLRVTSVATGCARLIASTALLNWGRPLRRMFAGPPTAEIASVIDVLPPVPYELLRAEVERQAERHAQVNRRHPVGKGVAVCVSMLGRQYVTKAEEILRNLYRQRDRPTGAVS